MNETSVGEVPEEKRPIPVADGRFQPKPGDQERLVDAKSLLRLLWDDDSRPSLRWLREQQARRAIPYVKIGARVWFRPSEVGRHIQDRWTLKRR
jgi:hypothetical protein